MYWKNRANVFKPAPALNHPRFKDIWPNFTEWKTTIITGRNDGLTAPPTTEEQLMINNEAIFNRLVFMCSNANLKYPTESDNKINLIMSWERNYDIYNRVSELYDNNIKYQDWLKNTSDSESRGYLPNGMELKEDTEEEITKYLANRNTLKASTQRALLDLEPRLQSLLYRDKPIHIFLKLLKADLISVFMDNSGGTL